MARKITVWTYQATNNHILTQENLEMARKEHSQESD